MAQYQEVAGPRPVEGATEIRAQVTIEGGVSGQLAIGSNIVQMRADHWLGNVVNILAPGTLPTITERPGPIKLLPRRPVPMFGRADETTLVATEIVGRRAVEVSAPWGAGKSTFLRHLAHYSSVEQACGGVVHLSARGQSRDDLLQSLFEAFYTSDIPVRPTLVELRHRLQHVRAALLLDDVDLTDDEMQELEDFAPECAFVLADERSHPSTGARSVHLPGLPSDASSQLLSYGLGRSLLPGEEPAADALCGLARGQPGRLLQLAADGRALLRFPGRVHGRRADQGRPAARTGLTGREAPARRPGGDPGAAPGGGGAGGDHRASRCPGPPRPLASVRDRRRDSCGCR